MRLIDADALLKDADKRKGAYGWIYSKEDIENAPTIEAEPVRHGEWVNPYINFYGHPCHCCSECGFKASFQDKNYCPNCGAKMDGGEKE